MVEYKVGFDFMFCFVETFVKAYPDDENLRIIYDQFNEIRKKLENRNYGIIYDQYDEIRKELQNGN